MDGSIWSTVLLFVLMGGVLYFLMIRPQQKRAKEQKDLMTSLEPGTRVMLISGILATIKYVGDKQAVVEVSPGVEMTIDKRAISPQPVTDEFEYADDAADATDDADAPAAHAAETEPAASVAPLAATAEAEVVQTDTADQSWENPGTTRN
jgi:preprotein translocase subunit YajC